MILRAVLMLVALLVCTGARPASAEERILSFHSDIRVAEDGSMTVQETIKVAAEGNRIKRGIYRDFPTRYKDRFGNTVEVEFEVLGVSRDNAPEPWHMEKRSNGWRIYAGEASVLLAPGEYTYRFRYRTSWQLGFFEDSDELYWNVTGNGWLFPIDQASATVELPAAVPAGQLHVEGYTGPQGSKETHFRASIDDGVGFIESTVGLRPGEGLTLVMTWPKGVITEPGPADYFVRILAANAGLLLALLALLGSSMYLLLQWHRVGRDPEEGVIFPHYEPPENHSPASLRDVQRMGYDNKTFTAAIINLAVKGHLSIDCDKKLFGLAEIYTLKRTPSEEPLSPGEEEVLKKLFIQGATLELKNKNHKVLSGARSAHKKALARSYHKRYFNNNGAAMLPSAIGAGLILLLILVSGSFTLLVLPVYGLIIVVHILFAWLLKAPSSEGRKLMDQSQGFQLYLEVAEKDELNLRNPPELTPRLFEAYLPFAIALGVEQQWAEQFSEVFAKLAAAGQSGGHYRPGWYHGDFDHTRINRFTQSVGSELDSAISSSAKAPGSSSGSGGGGSSGGGGGGGGGGGW